MQTDDLPVSVEEAPEHRGEVANWAVRIGVAEALVEPQGGRDRSAQAAEAQVRRQPWMLRECLSPEALNQCGVEFAPRVARLQIGGGAGEESRWRSGQAPRARSLASTSC